MVSSRPARVYIVKSSQNKTLQVLVAYACNPRYSGGRDLKPAQKIVQETLS
jgi:hypothetical protein